MSSVTNTWSIQCHHTPDIIDRILMQLRKRGMKADRFEYKKINETEAECLIEFEDVPANADRIYKNMQRTQDLIKISKLK